jgi:HTH-type transcriptional regulator/antitoxin HipB
MDTFHELGDALSQRRKALRKTQAQVAQEAGLRQEEVSRLENARLPDFTVGKLLKLARALSLEVTVRPRESAKPTLETLLVERRSGANTGPGEL